MKLRLTGEHASAIGLLRVLLVASLIVPALLLVTATSINYRATIADAHRELDRLADVAREHATRAFDGQDQVIERVNSLVRDLDEASVIASELRLHQEMADIVSRLPQIQGVLVVSHTGRPLVSASVYPMPPGDVSHTDYFKAVMEGASGTYVSNLQVGTVLKRPFFGLAGSWRGANGATKGVINIAVSPGFFRDFYRAIADQGGSNGKVLVLVRKDGHILVRYPELAGPAPTIPRPHPFFDATAASPESGSYFGRSAIDREKPNRLYAYRKVDGYPLYVVAGRSLNAILAEWYWTIAGHLAIGIPATAALFMITRTALIRTRREQESLARAKQEIARRELAEAALLHSQRLEAVGQMTGGVAHDFNNILTVIIGNIELISKRGIDDTTRRLTANIGLAARRGADITQKLLAFSGYQIVNPEIVNLNRRLQEFKPLLDRAASEAIEVVLDLDPALDPVRLDPGQFESAILNLVGNARDAMPTGGHIAIATSNVELMAHSDVPPGHYVRVTVTDDGTGMTADIAAKAFEPFFTTKEVGKGTGLGLSQVYGFARQAGGTASIATGRAGGTAVTLLLPRSLEGAWLERSGAEIVPLRMAARGEVVLVVEDDPNVLEIAVERLRGLGYTILTARDAQAALALLREPGRIDLLFSDVVMPGGMNGVRLASEAVRLRPGLKVLMTSGYAGGSVRNELPTGIPLLMKPYDSGQLSHQLRAVLNAR